MTRKTFLILLAIFTSLAGFSQQDWYLGGSLQGGIPFNSYGNNKTILHPKALTSYLSGNLFLEYIFFKRIGIEAGISQNLQLWKMQDREFAQTNEGFKIKLKTAGFYWSYHGALVYYQPLSNYTNLYAKAGYSMHQIGGGSARDTKNFIVTDENVHLENNFENQSQSWFIEAGIQEMLSDKMTFLAGIRFNKGLSPISSGNYYSEKQGTIIRQDNFTSDGTFIALNIGLKYNLFHKDKRVRQPKQKKVKQLPTPEPKKEVQSGDTLSNKVDGRSLIVNQKIHVASPTVKIFVWDDQKVDGDRISLNLNGQWIMTDYSLQKQQKSLEVNLQKGDNILVLHALNLGDIPPNTAMLLVDDGHKQQKLNLASDLNSSGTLIIQYNP